MKERPKIGIGVIVIRNNKVLLGFRKSAHGSGAWQFPGGHLEFMESFEECACREVYEEVGIEICNIDWGPYTNDIFLNDSKHYVTIFMLAEYKSGDVLAKEPDKSDNWGWFNWEELPTPLFLPVSNLYKRYPQLNLLLRQ